MLYLSHYALSLPERCSSLWWTRQTGTRNSWLTCVRVRELCKGEVVRVRRGAAAHETGLSQDVSPVVLIAQPNFLPKERTASL
jgi:hypothetical protein